MRGDEPQVDEFIELYRVGFPHMRGDEPSLSGHKYQKSVVSPTCVGMNRRLVG